MRNLEYQLSRARGFLERTARWIATGAAAMALSSGAYAASDGAAVLHELGCADCHAVAAPKPEERTLAAYATRKGPDLFYAGSKYRPEWLHRWLAHPIPIRPAGLHPADRTRTAADGDHLSAEALPAHPAVAPNRVDAVVSALVSLSWGRQLTAAATPTHAAVPRALAELNFVKFKGCGSCHRTSSASPPLSGPDLVDAFQRLRPEFLASVIATPQAWDPVAPMPGYGLEPVEVAKLVEYLRLVSEEDHAAQTR